MPPKKRNYTTDQEFINSQQQNTERILTAWELILGLPLTNPTPRLMNLQARVEMEREDLIDKWGDIIRNFLQHIKNQSKPNDPSSNKLRQGEGNNYLDSYFELIKEDYPLLNQLYSQIFKYFTQYLYRFTFYFRDIYSGITYTYTQVSNDILVSELKTIILGYFIKLPFTITEAYEDSNGYFGDVFDYYSMLSYFDLAVLAEKLNSKGGGLFKFKNSSQIDLEYYQVYRDESQLDDQPHCLVNCLTKLLGERVVSEKKSQLQMILNKCHENDDFDTLYLGEIGKLFDIYIHVYKPKKLNGIYQNKGIDKTKNSYPPKNDTLYPNRKIITIGLFENHYFPHNKITQGVKEFTSTPDNKKRYNYNLKTTSTRYLVDLWNAGKFKQPMNLVNHEINRKVFLYTLDFIKDEQKSFKKTGPEEIYKARHNMMNRKKLLFIDNLPEDLQDKYYGKDGKVLFNKVKNISVSNYYCDCEAMFDENNHIPYSIGKIDYYANNYEMFKADPNNPLSSNLTKEFLNSFEPETISILNFHNMRYDYSLLQRIGLGTITSILQKDTTLYSIEFYYNNRYFILYDTFKKVNRSLSVMANMFNLTNQKIGYTLYELYTVEAMKLDKVKYQPIPYNKISQNHIKYFITEKEAKRVSSLPKDNSYILINNYIVINSGFLSIIEPKYLDNNYFNHKTYYDDYLKVDCLVLREAMIKFDDLMVKIMGEDYYSNQLTISAIGDTFACSRKSFKKVSEVTGQLQNFCKLASRGGRVCISYNKPINTFEDPAIKKIEDFDATSLYPSAIVKLKEIFGGIPAGECVKTNSFVNDKFGIYRIKSISITKERAIPILSIEKDGIIDWTNDVTNKEFILDYFTLQDAIKFQGLKYELIEGVIWNNYDPTLSDIILELFQERAKYIDLKNKETDPIKKGAYSAISEMLKLIMNSIYGKCGLKKSPKNIIVEDEANFNYTCHYYYNRIYPMISPEIKTIDGKKLFQYGKFNGKAHFNRQHIASAILGASKSIMNPFICLAEDIGLKLLYTDTDSLHIITEHPDYFNKIENYSLENNGSKILQDKYIEIYGVDPIGPGLGQFKSDFKMSGEYNNIYSKNGIFLAKKMYCHLLTGTDKNNNQIDEIDATMKGISDKALNIHSNNYYEGNTLKVYENIYNGKTEKIDMRGNNTLTCFDVRVGNISHKESFTRNVSIITDEIQQQINNDNDNNILHLCESYNLTKQLAKRYLKIKLKK